MHGTCHGNAAQVEGNHNTIALVGSCAGLRLNGVANQVTIDLGEGAAIHIEGSANRVVYRVAGGNAPSVVALGAGNVVAAAAPARPREQPVAMIAPAGPLILAGDDQQRLADCAGRDVAIRGMRSAYVLRGGCRSVTVVGDLNIIQAEITAGTPITIEGAGTIVAWAIPGAGPQAAEFGPVERVRGRESRVQRTDTIGGQPVR